MARHRLICRVVAIDVLTHDIRRVRLRIDSGRPFMFAAGQYAEVTFPGQPARDYSMANRPGEAALEFHIRALDEGSVSRFVTDRLKPGDDVQIEGPFGECYYRPAHEGPIVTVAGGSGLAPIKAIVEEALTSGARAPINLYFGVRDERDLYLEDHFEALAARHHHFRFVPALSEPASVTERRTGFIAELLSQDFDDLDGAKAYLAGPPAMVDSCAEALKRLGLRESDCHADPFVSMEEKARRAP